MRILLALLSCLLLPTPLVLASDETSSLVTVESSASQVFQNYEEALVYAQKESIPLIIVVVSDSHHCVLSELVRRGFDLGDFFGFSLEGVATVVVLQPEDSESEDNVHVQEFKDRFPSSNFTEFSGVFMVTVLVDGDQETVVDITKLDF
ncbi:hypothetical protein [Chlamydia felis Fe/C-56]|uniref:Uncharacterized protein n=1 Tax=Chlamydia felis (strain Fe/C-56) TaxID=264202 RepID=Q255S6_CHLFF|nr:hypothetical protein [Chlamydia felis]BAE80962.1 hypothetical protein [Chlamydia felis Fe/C-56]